MVIAHESSVPRIPRKIRNPATVYVRDTPLVRAARWALYAGLFSSSDMAMRVGAGFTVGDLLIGASVSLVALDTKRRRVAPVAGWAPVVVLLTFIAAALSGFRSSDPGGALAVALRVAYLACSVQWAMRNTLGSRRQLATAINWFAAGAAVCAGATALQLLFGPEILPGTVETNAGRFSGLAQSVSDTGGIACVGVVVAVAMLGPRSSLRRVVFAVVLIALGLIGLVLSGSVSGMIATCAGVLYLLVRGNLRPRTATLLGILVVLAGGVALHLQSATAVALSPLQRLMQTVGLTAGAEQLNTTASRLDTMRAGIDGIVKSPIVGAGLDSQSGIVVGTLQVHNFFLAAAYQGGLLFLIALLIPVAISWMGLWRRLRAGTETTRANAAFLTALVFAMTAPSFYNRYFWIPVALAFTAHSMDARGITASRMVVGRGRERTASREAVQSSVGEAASSI